MQGDSNPNKKLMWALGTGRGIQFWNHYWVLTLDDALSKVATQHIADYMLYKLVEYFVDGAD